MIAGEGLVAGVRVVRPIVEDFAYLARRMRPDEIAQYLAFSGEETYDPDAAARRFIETAGPTFAVIGPDGMPLVAGGFWPVRGGVYECWLVGTLESWSTHWRAITKFCRRLIAVMLEQSNVHRIQLCGMTGRDAAFHWYERSLGFTREGTLYGYCASGSDAVMFSRRKVQP